MTDDTRDLIARDIRLVRGWLTSEQTWWQRQDAGHERRESFGRINFWRNVLRDAERRLDVGDVGEADSVDRPRPDSAVLA